MSTETSSYDQPTFLLTVGACANFTCVHTVCVLLCVFKRVCVCVGRVKALLPTAAHSVSLAVVKKKQKTHTHLRAFVSTFSQKQIADFLLTELNLFPVKSPHMAS